MPLNVTLILVITAFICTILSALSYVPLWIAVLLLVLVELLHVMPLGH